MIQEIAPHQYDLTYRQPEPKDDDYVLYIKSSKTLLRKCEDGNYEIPCFSDFPMEKPRLKMKAYYLFSIDGRGYYYVREMLQEEGNGYEFCPTSVYRTMKPMYQAFAGITATQIHRFKESRRFCGRCGHETEDSKTERALVCPFCGQVEYPKISPAVIVAVTDGDRLLMSRYRVSHNPYRSYALIAGFVEIGETFEDTVRREDMEEVGLKVNNIRYYKSQPWAFSDTLLMGFYCDLDGSDEITLDREELSLAEWFAREDIPVEPSRDSLTNEMIIKFKLGEV